VFARTAKAERSLLEQFREHTIERRYLALVRGQPNRERLNRAWCVIAAMAGAAARPVKTMAQAATHVKIIEGLGDYTLVECRLETGRTHQVRIHLGEQGAPLCGEHVYDRPLNGQPIADASGAERPLLHAAKLGFRHPETEEKMSWSCLCRRYGPGARTTPRR